MRPQIPEGIQERVVHLRRPVDIPGVLMPVDVLRMIGVEAEPQGGSTLVILSREGKVVAHGWSVCMGIDNYNKRLGRDIALGRALSDLVSPTMTQFQVTANVVTDDNA